MKLRNPKAIPDSLKNAEIDSAPAVCKTFTVKLITPLYGGGVIAGQPDPDMPIRASAIRGQLRFWWRMLNPDKNFADEQAIWGGMGDKAAVASRVRVRVKDVKHINQEPCAEYEAFMKRKPNGERVRKQKINWLYNGSAYALFPAQGELEIIDGHQEVKKHPDYILMPDLTFKLEIEILGSNQETEQLWNEQIELTLRWWASFGGLGARVRRGLGSICVEDLEPVTDVSAVKGCQLHYHANGNTNNAINAWTSAVKKLQDFRQGRDIGRNPGQDNRPGRSYWSEADSVRTLTKCHSIAPKNHAPIHPVSKITPDYAFPRAVFGLPIILDFPNNSPRNNRPDNNQDPIKSTLTPIYQGEEQERMSSPIILKAMWTGNGYRAIALLLPNHTKEMGLELKYNNNEKLKETRQDFSKSMKKPDNWYSPAAKAAMKDTTNPDNHSPLKNRSTDGDVLQAFLAFFQERG